MKETTEEYNTQYGEIIKDPFFLKDQELFELFKKSLPPREAYYFFPKGADVLVKHKWRPEKNVRRIFVNVPLLDVEKKWLEDFKKILAKHPETKLPDYWNDGLNLAFIYSTECKLEKSYKRMVEYFAWYKQYFPINIQPGDKCLKILNSGFLYIFGRDHQFRPILICQPYILQKNKKEFAINDIYNASFFLCQYMVNYMMIPGQIENWIILINLEGTDGVTLPTSMTKLVRALSDYFISRLYKCYVLGLHPFLRFIYNIVCKIIAQITVEKIVVLNNKEDPKKNEYINPENIEKRFGGEALDLDYDEDNSLFPPRMPTEEFFLENEYPKDILISEEEYLEKFKAGSIPLKSASPYIPDDIKKERIEQERLEKEKEEQEKAEEEKAEKEKEEEEKVEEEKKEEEKKEDEKKEEEKVEEKKVEEEKAEEKKIEEEKVEEKKAEEKKAEEEKPEEIQEKKDI